MAVTLRPMALLSLSRRSARSLAPSRKLLILGQNTKASLLLRLFHASITKTPTTCMSVCLMMAAKPKVLTEMLTATFRSYVVRQMRAKVLRSPGCLLVQPCLILLGPTILLSCLPDHYAVL